MSLLNFNFSNLKDKDKSYLSIIVGWVLVNAIMLFVAIANDLPNSYSSNVRYFWPFDKAPFTESYDFSEFFVYALSPLLVYLTILFISKKISVKINKSYQTPKVLIYIALFIAIFLFFGLVDVLGKTFYLN